jgi:hypothetical protein
MSKKLDKNKGGKAAKNHCYGISFFYISPILGRQLWRPRPHMLLSIWERRKPAQHIDLLKPRYYGQIPQRHIKQINFSGIYLSLKFPLYLHLPLAELLSNTICKFNRICLAAYEAATICFFSVRSFKLPVLGMLISATLHNERGVDY